MLLCGAVAVSTGALFIRYADAAPPMAKAAWRCALAAIFLLLLGRRKVVQPLARLSSKQRWRLLLAGFFLALHFATWIQSLSLTSVASSLFLVNTVPIWTAMLAPIFISERTTRAQWIGATTCLVGAAVLGWGEISVGGTALVGDALAIAGAICWAGFFILGRDLQKQVSGYCFLFTTYASAALFLIAGCLLLQLPMAGYPPATYGWLLLLALVPQMIGHSAYNLSLRHFPAATVSITVTAEPVLGTLLAWIFLAETLAAPTLLGGAILLGGIYLATARS